MLRWGLLLALLAAVGAALAPLAAPLTNATALRAIVGPGATITLVDEGGSRVQRLAPGDYTITVDDRSVDHNFHLDGPGVDVSTDIAFVGSRTFDVTLREGVYTYMCDAHAATMRGTLTVGDAPPPTTTTAAPPAVRTLAPGPLTATVGPRATIAVARGAVRARVLRRGRYTITVRDRSRLHNFHLRGPGVNRKTGVAFVGTKRWVVTLRRGTYTFRCDKHPLHMRGSVKVP